MVQNWGIQRCFAPLVLHPVQNAAKAQCCPREATAGSVQAAAQVEEGCVAFPTFSSPVQQALHSMQVNTFLSIARGENVMIEAW